MKAFYIVMCFTGVVPVIFSLLATIVHDYYLIPSNMTWPAAQIYCRETYTDLATLQSDRDWLTLSEVLASQVLTDVTWIGLYKVIDSWLWSYQDIPLSNTFTNFGGGFAKLNGFKECIMTGPVGVWWAYNCSILFPFICFNVNISATGRYIGVNSPKNWSDAQAYCRRFYTDLAFINSTAEHNMMKSIANVQGGSWIGPYAGTWKWSDGTNTSNLTWRPGQPDNYYGNENCSVLNNGVFDDVECNEMHYSICQEQRDRKMQILRLQLMSDGKAFDSDAQSAILELVRQKLGKNGTLNIKVTWRVQSNGEIFHKRNTIATTD